MLPLKRYVVFAFASIEIPLFDKAHTQRQTCAENMTVVVLQLCQASGVLGNMSGLLLLHENTLSPELRITAVLL